MGHLDLLADEGRLAITRRDGEIYYALAQPAAGATAPVAGIRRSDAGREG
jgi:hypothetical protein